MKKEKVGLSTCRDLHILMRCCYAISLWGLKLFGNYVKTKCYCTICVILQRLTHQRVFRGKFIYRRYIVKFRCTIRNRMWLVQVYFHSISVAPHLRRSLIRILLLARYKGSIPLMAANKLRSGYYEITMYSQTSTKQNFVSLLH